MSVFIFSYFDLIKKDELIPLAELNSSIISGKLNRGKGAGEVIMDEEA
jgi:hypothetical protein